MTKTQTQTKSSKTKIRILNKALQEAYAVGNEKDAKSIFLQLKNLGAEPEKRILKEVDFDIKEKMVPYNDFHNHSCILVRREKNKVVYITLDLTGLKISKISPAMFADRFKKMQDYPIEKMCLHYLKFAKRVGASTEVLNWLELKIEITNEEREMVTAKKTVQKTDINVATSKVTKIKKPTAAAMFQKLIMEGKFKDAEIFQAVQKEFNLDDNKKWYTSWYRNYLKKKGKNPPDAIKDSDKKVIEKKAPEKKKVVKKKTPAKKKVVKKKSKLYSKKTKK